MTGTIIRNNVQGTSGNVSGSADSTSEEDFSEDLETRIGVLVAITVAVGIWQLILGVLGLGNLSVYLSDQLVKGFTTGAAFHVFTSQLKSIFGLRKLKSHNGPLKLIYTYIEIFSNIHLANVPTLIISSICIVSLLLVKFLFNSNPYVQSMLPYKIPIPSELMVVIFGSLASYMMDLRGPAYNVSVVGSIPLGLPAPRVPSPLLLSKIMVDSIGIAIVSFAITMSLAKLYANKYGYSVGANQELRAMGISNLFSGFFLCMPSTGSLGRAAVQTAMGGATQVVSIVSCAMVLIVILALGFLLEPLPNACLASIIVVALTGLLGQVTEVRHLWKISALDTSVFLAALLGVIVLDVDYGLGVAVGWSLLTVVFRTQRPDVAVLGRAVHTDIYKRMDVYKSIVQVPGCKIVRFESPLYFANSDYFLDQMKNISGIIIRDHDNYQTIASGSESSGSRNTTPESVEVGYDNTAMNVMDLHPIETITEIDFVRSPSPGSHEVVGSFSRPTLPSCPPEITHIILDCSSMSFVDINGVKAVKEFAHECKEAHMTLFLASCKANVREILALSGYTTDFPIEHTFITIHDAVMEAMKSREKDNQNSPTNWETEIFVSQDIESVVDDVHIATTHPAGVSRFYSLPERPVV